jgi:DNA-binding transcriptional ArsR family regulator
MLSSISESRTTPQYLNLVFKALGDHTRRDLLARLAQGPAMVTELAKPYNMSLPAVGKHLRVLEKAGLIERRVNGRIHRCALNPSPLKSAGDWIRQYRMFWNETLDSLDEYFQNDTDNEKDI